MEVIIQEPHEGANLAADAIVALLDAKPDAVLGLATGSSPLGVYRALTERYRAGEVSFAKASAFLLDEYVGLEADHPQRYRNVIHRDLVGHVDLDSARVHTLDGLATDIPGECARFEQAIVDAGGVDLQLLGIGTDGHIAFNEPGSSLASRTRIKTLTAQTRRDNARFFADDESQVPTHCLTQGLATIMAARHIILLAQGRAKSEAIHQLVEGPVSAMWPATALQHHPHATVLVDEEAAGRLQLQLVEYFRRSHATKPAWQGL
ncbi:MAG TPA: glucosamine-6-phosphate deaminase [Beutenbergiaceae bacterium]|nr:glucosamine-6-phosphate deaminase [Beutenbergiaceae bacterium]